MDDEDRKIAIARMATSLEFQPVELEKVSDSGNATRIPLGDLALAGGALASFAEPFRTITTTMQTALGPDVYVATFEKGLSHTLTAFKDGSGFTNLVHGATGIEGQARLNPLTSATSTATTMVPVDPATLAIAVALAEVNMKLDAIQETQRQMFDWIQRHEKAGLEAKLHTLGAILDEYKFNWDDDKFKNASLQQVRGIRSEAERGILTAQSDLGSAIGNPKAPHFGKDASEASKAIRRALENYQLSLYLYSFAAFLNVLLLENFSAAYLKQTQEKIEERSQRFREYYSHSFDGLEHYSKSAIGSSVLGGVSTAFGGLGGFISKTSLGDATPIDEALFDASKGIGDFRMGFVDDTMKRMIEAKDSNVLPFIQSIQAINQTYNQPTIIRIDASGVTIQQLSA